MGQDRFLQTGSPGPISDKEAPTNSFFLNTQHEVASAARLGGALQLTRHLGVLGIRANKST